MLPDQMLPTRLDVDHHHKLLSSSILAARKTIPKMVQCFLSPISLQKTIDQGGNHPTKTIQVAFANVGCDEQGDAWTDAIAFLHEFLGFFLAHNPWQEKNIEKPLIYKVKWRHGGRKSHFLQRIFVGLPVAFPDLNFRKVHVSQVETPQFPDYPSTPTCHLGRNTSNKITTMPAKKSCMMIRIAQVPPLSRTTPGRLVKPIEHLLKKNAQQTFTPNCQAPSAKFTTHLSPLFTVLFIFLQQHHHGAISFSYGDLLLVNPWPCR